MYSKIHTNRQAHLLTLIFSHLVDDFWGKEHKLSFYRCDVCGERPLPKYKLTGMLRNTNIIYTGRQLIVFVMTVR